MRASRLLGRLRSGEDTGGRIVHALDHNSTYEPALCGVKPGKRSVGWEDDVTAKVTCPRCIKKMSQLIVD